MANRRGKVKAVRFPLLDLQSHCIWWLQPWNQKTIASWQENDDKPRQHVEKQRHYSADKGLYNQDYGVSSGHVQLWKLDLKEGRMLKNWCLHTVLLEKTPKSPLNCKEIKSVNLKGDQPWIFTEAEAPVCWSSDNNTWLIGKVPDVGKDWGQKKKRTSEDEMAVWNHWCNEHELGQTPEDSEEQRGLACCSPWGCQLSDATGRLNNNNNNKYYLVYMCNIFFIQSSIDEVLGCSQVLSFINSAAVNIGVDVSFWMIIFSEYTHSSRITMS